MPRVSKKQKLESIHYEAMNRYDIATSADRVQRDKCLQDIRFAQTDNGQWEQYAVENRRDRPRYTINKVAPAVDKMLGRQRQTRQQAKIMPSGNGANKEYARILQGLIKNIEVQSDADDAYDNAFDYVANGGFGAWRIKAEYCDDSTFEQDIKIERIKNPVTSVWYDPSAIHYDKRDAMYVFVGEEMTTEEYKRRYPDFPVSNMPEPKLNQYTQCYTGWASQDMVRVAEYWRKVPVKSTVALLSTGETIEFTDKVKKVADELAASGVEIVKTREVNTFKVEMYLINGVEVMEQHSWAGKYIPIIPVFGRFINVDQADQYRGIVRNAKDAQRIYNYATSQNIETIALSPKQPYFLTPKMVEGHESAWRTFNVTNPPALLFNPDPESGLAKPTRDAPAQQNVALIQQTVQADQDIQACLNMFEPTMGKDDTDKSGKAIMALQDQAHESLEVFYDNLRKSKKYGYEILVDLIPKIYDTARTVRIIGDEEQSEEVQINSTIIDQQSGEPVIVNDLSKGKYDVVVTTGPQFASKKVEAVNVLTRLAEANPELGALTQDLMAKNLDFPFSEELTKRIRRQMIQSGMVEPTDEEKEELGIDEQAMAQAQQQQQQLQAQLMETQILQSELENQKLAAEVDKYAKQVQETDAKIYKTLVDAAIAKREAGLPLSQDEVEAIQGYTEVVENNAADSLEEVYGQDAAIMGDLSRG